MSLSLIQLLSYIQIEKNAKFTKIDLADALGVSRQYLDQIKDKELSYDFIERVTEATGVDFYNAIHATCFLQYWEGIKDFPYIKSKDMEDLVFDKDFIRKYWHRGHKALRLINMVGDEMDGVNYRIKNEDLLLMCIDEKNPSISGVYVYTTEVNRKKNLFISGIRQFTTGSLEFFYDKYPPRERSLEELQAINFKVAGKVLANLSETFD